MNKFENFSATVAAFDRSNIDTDAIIPKQYLKSIKRSGFGVNLFDDWRYLDPGEPGKDNSERRLNPDFVLNKSPYQLAQILLARENFACGSSREHAVWALLDFGIKVVIAPSFADIFYNNSFKNGILPIVLSEDKIKELAALSEKQVSIEVNLDEQKITKGDNQPFEFEVDPFRKECLLNGYDDVALTLKKENKIQTFIENNKNLTPWLY